MYLFLGKHNTGVYAIRVVLIVHLLRSAILP